MNYKPNRREICASEIPEQGMYGTVNKGVKMLTAACHLLRSFMYFSITLSYYSACSSLKQVLYYPQFRVVGRSLETLVGV